MAGSVSESRSSDTSTRSADSTRGTSETSRSSNTTGASLSRDMAEVSTRDVQAEAANVTRGDTVTDGVDRPATHTVERGDTLTGIAREHGVTLDNVVSANPQIRDPDLIHVGDQINIPGTRATTGTTTPVDPTTVPSTTLERGAKGPEVEALQTRLTELGYATGPIDGDFGRITEGAVRSFQQNNELPVNGTADAATLEALRSPDARRPDPARTEFPTYRPGSAEQIALFEEAARAAGLPESWARSPGLIAILDAESGGMVGRPNYTYGNRSDDPTQWASVHEELRSGNITARSSATGLGQLLLSNVDAYYPSGRQGIGNPQEEAIGMMRYIQDRYGNPDQAWREYGVHHEGY